MERLLRLLGGGGHAGGLKKCDSKGMRGERTITIMKLYEDNVV